MAEPHYVVENKTSRETELPLVRVRLRPGEQASVSEGIFQSERFQAALAAGRVSVVSRWEPPSEEAPAEPTPEPKKKAPKKKALKGSKPSRKSKANEE